MPRGSPELHDVLESMYGGMTYELAKQLKNAGFPQIGGSVFTHETEASIFLGSHGQLIEFKDDGKYESMPRHPSLSELIEACGDDFGGLQKTENGYDVWSKTDLSKIVIKKYNCGTTPEEAVARLYLELHHA